MERKTGARGLRAIMESTLMDLMYKTPSDDTIRKCIITKEAVEGTGEPLPGMIIHFDVSRERSKKAIEAAMFQDQKIFLVTQKDPQIEDPGFVQLFQVGTIAYIKQVVKLPDNLLRVLVEGKRRAELLGLEQETPYLRDCSC